MITQTQANTGQSEVLTHRDKSLGNDYMVLSRQHGEKPGWFKIDNIVPAGH